MSEAIQTKKAVSVSEMARMAGLSRSRFYQLIGTAFPPPVYDAKTRRPFYTASQQQTCLEVRHRNCGIDGRPVLFYARRPMQSVRPQGRRKSKSSSPKSGSRVGEILDGVRGLGLASATERQVEHSVRECFPAGVGHVDRNEIIRAVFVRLMR